MLLKKKKSQTFFFNKKYFLLKTTQKKGIILKQILLSSVPCLVRLGLAHVLGQCELCIRVGRTRPWIILECLAVQHTDLCRLAVSTLDMQGPPTLGWHVWPARFP